MTCPCGDPKFHVGKENKAELITLLYRMTQDIVDALYEDGPPTDKLMDAIQAMNNSTAILGITMVDMQEQHAEAIRHKAKGN